MAAVLEVRGLSKRFGSLEVTRSVSLRLEEGERCALIGPNGAGKTTLIDLIAGRVKPSAGEIWIGGRAVTAMSEAARVKAGVGRTFQITRLFRRLSIEENLALAVAERLGVAWHLRPNRGVRARVDARVAGILELLRLEHEPRRPVEVLPYGVQRMVSSDSRWRSSRRSCCSTNPRLVFRARTWELSSLPSRSCRPRWQCC